MEKYKGLLISMTISAAVLVGLVYSFGGSNTSAGHSDLGGGASAGEGKLTARESFFDFGSISMAKGNVSYNFTVKNDSADPVTIKKIYTSCMCTTATLVRSGGEKVGPFGMPGHGIVPSISEKLEPGEEAQIEAVFDPAAHGPSGLGTIERAIAIETKDGGRMELGFKVTVTP